MEYTLNLGTWNSIFAVPCIIVDQHLKLAGAAQLKVILWALRHAGESFGVEDIAAALSMHEADVRDSLQYWVQTGVIAMQDTELLPTPLVEAAPVQTAEPLPEPKPSAALVAVAPGINQAPHRRSLSRPEKPDMKYLTERMQQDESIRFLMQSADEIFGRMTSVNDKATLLLIHEYDGLPVEVLIMLLQYAFSIGKGNMRYIEKMAISWAEEEITTLEAADRKIRGLTGGRNAAKRLQRILGQDEHSPTEKEIQFAELWLNQWKFSDEMIRAAYEVCVDAKGKYIPKYTGSVLENWYHAGYREPSQIKKQQTAHKNTKAPIGYEAAYDIAEYESTSVLDYESTGVADEEL